MPANEVASLETMREREAELRDRLLEMAEHAKALMSAGMLQAVGYRVLIKPITIKRTLEGSEAAALPTLAAKGFETKSEKEREREERGENHGIVIHVGPLAFDRFGGREAWCTEGDTVVFSRYAGTRVEHPPGSKNFFQILNDEDIFGKII